MRRTAIATLAAVCAAFASAAHQSTASVSEELLRADLTAFAHDTMEGRAIGTRGGARATSFIVTRLREAGVRPALSGGFLQAVPLVRTQVDTSSARAWLQLSQPDSVERPAGAIWSPGGMIPVTGAFGLNSARRAAVPIERLGAARVGTGVRTRSTLVHATYVFGGRLGESTINPVLTDNRIVVFLPPRHADGTPSHELWSVRETLREYKGAAAIVISSLDLMPTAFVSRMLAPQWILRDSKADVPDMPPMIAVTHKWGARVMPTGRGTVRFESTELPVREPVSNIVAMVEGSDARLKNEYVIVSAALDHRGVRSRSSPGEDSIYNGASAGSGAIGLVALARHFAAAPAKPGRSILFVVTTAEEHGFLGAEYFADHSIVPLERIVASISLGSIAARTASPDSGVEVRGSAAALQSLGQILEGAISDATTRVRIQATSPLVCEDGSWHFFRRGIATLHMSAPRDSRNSGLFDDASDIDFARLKRVTEFAVDVVERLASVPEVQRAATSDISAGTPCVR